MKTVFSSLRHTLSIANVTHIIWCTAILLIMLILAVLHHKWKEDTKKLRIWRLLFLIPLIICGVHACRYVVGSFYLYDVCHRCACSDTYAVCKAQGRLPRNRCADRSADLSLWVVFLRVLTQCIQSLA